MAISLPPDAPSGPKNTVVTGVGEKDSPAFPHPTYTKLKSRWEKCRTLMGETEEVRAAGAAILVPFPKEDTESFELRKKLVAVSNFFKRAVFASVGLLLEKNPALGDDMPEKLVTYSEDIDLGGKHLDIYARELALDRITDGCVGTFVDFPRVENPAAVSSDEADRRGLRPFFVKYERSEILKIVEGKVNGVTTRLLVVLRETAEEQDGEFGIKNVVRYRVLRNPGGTGVIWERWEGTANSTETKRVEGPMPLIVGGVQAKKIPFSLFGEFDELPPLENLADLNIEHHNLKTNRRNIEFLAMVPTQVRIGAKPEVDVKTGEKKYPPIELGTRRVIEAPYPPKDAGAIAKPVYWHSPDVSVLEPSRESLTDIQSDMGTAALNFLAPDKRAPETATSKRIGVRAEKASLSTVGRGLQDHLEECYGYAAEYIRAEGGSVAISLDFENSALTAEEMKVYLDAVIAGKLSLEEFLEAWKRGKRLDESLDVVDEVRRIHQQNALPPENANPQGEVVAE